MGNADGFKEAMDSTGQNSTINFKGGYFSFAFGNEIALALDGDYFILNCDKQLWLEVAKQVKTLKTKAKLKSWWKKQSSNHEINDWSTGFEDL